MVLLILTSLFIIIGVPLTIWYLIKNAVKAKEQGDEVTQWFLIWFIGVISLAIVVVGIGLIF